MTDQPAPQPGDDLPGIWAHADFEGGEADAEDGATRQKRAASLRLVAVMTKNGELSPSEVPGLLAELGHAGCVPRSRADEAYQQGREHESYDHWGAIARAEAENVRLREALRFYADPETYIEGDWPPGAIDGEIPIEKDQGAVARATLDGEDG